MTVTIPTAGTALLLIDVINDLEFDGGDRLLAPALQMAEQIARLRDRARALAIPAVYVNDNFGRWQSNVDKLIAHCLRDGVRGAPLVARLRPDSDEFYFVLKPKHSGFFSTTLDILLDYLGVKTLILTGLTGDICVLFTAHDAYMRDFNLVIPSDCVASTDPGENEYTLEKMERLLDADTRPSNELDFAELKKLAAREPEPNPEPQAQKFAAEN